jgi:hypothetical protein
MAGVEHLSTLGLFENVKTFQAAARHPLSSTFKSLAVSKALHCIGSVLLT